MTHKIHLSRRGLLLSSAGMGLLSLLPRRATAHPNSGINRLVIVRAMGGWDQTFCFDPKFAANPNIDGPDKWKIGNEEEGESGVEVTATLESSLTGNALEYAKNAKTRGNVDGFFEAHKAKCIVVNGILVDSIVHQDCTNRMFTGTRSADGPDIGMISCIGDGEAATLPYLDFTGSAFLGEYAYLAGQVGRNNQIIPLLDRSQQLNRAGSTDNFPLFTPTQNHRNKIDTYLESRHSSLEAAGYTDDRSKRRIEALLAAHDRKKIIIDEKDTLLNSGIEYAPEQRMSLTAQAELAAALMEQNFCHSVILDSGESWDNHTNLGNQHNLYDDLFAGLSALVTALDDLIESTMIVVLSEMGRTPKHNGATANPDSSDGKDHWPVTSALLISGEFATNAQKGCSAIGGTDENLNAMGINLETGEATEEGEPLNYEQFIAGVLHAAGVDSEEYLPNVEVLHGIID